MIIGSLTQTKRFEILHPDFKKVFEYVRSGNWQQVTAGKIILEEDKIWVNVDEVTGKSREAANWKHITGLSISRSPYCRRKLSGGKSGAAWRWKKKKAIRYKMISCFIRNGLLCILRCRLETL